MNKKEFENYLEHLPKDQYDVLIKERIGRLNEEQQVIAWAREEEKKEIQKLIDMLADPNPDIQEKVFNALADQGRDMCEHERSIWSDCHACMKIDHIMFPELFDEYGYEIEEDEESAPVEYKSDADEI